MPIHQQDNGVMLALPDGTNELKPFETELTAVAGVDNKAGNSRGKRSETLQDEKKPHQPKFIFFDLETCQDVEMTPNQWGPK
uniref:Uncharacterized protein n=1 Tax=Romanomermis culicivorax TaxID=13658 RepID=A0A915ICV2_ROMCU